MKNSASGLMILLLLCFVLTTLFLMNGHIDAVFSLDPAQATNQNETKLININTATAEELMLLPGIGEGLAQKIISYRQNHGPFQSVSELLNIDGLGQDTFFNIYRFVSIGG